jgi:RHS repeat-associated protein
MTEGLPLILNDSIYSYIYGPGGLPIERISLGNTIFYLHHDQQGSTRLLTNSSGAKEASFTYDAYGNTTGTTGTATTPFGYDGQYTSSDTGLVYMRARAYDPATAQFLTADPAVLQTRAPYNYAGDNPLNASDPTGFGNWLNLGLPSPGEVLEPLNPVQYYEKEIESYENGCGYLASVAHGLLGAVVGAADVAGAGALAEGIAGLAAREGATTIEDALAGLRPGQSPNVYEVNTPEEMNGLFAQLSKGGQPVESSYPGSEVQLPDGTRIGLRSTSSSGGPTIDINQDGNITKVHLAK